MLESFDESSEIGNLLFKSSCAKAAHEPKTGKATTLGNMHPEYLALNGGEQCSLT